jgi:hypothetical protein
MSETIFQGMSDQEIADLYNATTDENVRSAAIAELAHRDRKNATSRRDAARWAAVYSEWLDFAHAQYLAADAACNGYLLNRDGLAAGIDPWSLWSGSARRAERYASDELRNFWDANPRLTVTQFREHQRRAGRPF